MRKDHGPAARYEHLAGSPLAIDGETHCSACGAEYVYGFVDERGHLMAYEEGETCRPGHCVKRPDHPGGVREG